MFTQTQYTVILVTFNRLSSLEKVVTAITRQTVLPERLIIVDNHSEDGTHEYLDQLKMEIPIERLRTDNNLGHGAALALGMRAFLDKKMSPYLLLMEDDSIPKPGLAEKMLSWIEHSKYNIVCLDGLKFSLGKRIRPALYNDKIVDVDFGLLDGAIIKSDLLKEVGVPKEDFFMMCDDLEFSKRIGRHGIKIGCVKTNLHEILHMGGGKRFSRATLWRGYYQARNGMHVLKEYFSLWELVDFILLESKRTLGSLLAPDRFYRIYLRQLGIVHGLMGKKGKTLDPQKF